MLLVTHSQPGFVSVSDPKPADKVPANSVVRFSRKTFEAIWWVARIEGKSPGDLVEELCGDRLASRFKKVEPDVERLRKLDADTALAEAKAKQKLRGGSE